MDEERKEPDWFPNAKVYHNGSHYIAIPHTENKRKKRPKPQEKVFVVSEETDKKTVEGVVKTAPILPTLEILSDEDYPNCPFDEEYQTKGSIVLSENKQARVEKKERKVKLKRVTRSSEFNRLYVECKDKKVKEQKKYLTLYILSY